MRAYCIVWQIMLIFLLISRSSSCAYSALRATKMKEHAAILARIVQRSAQLINVKYQPTVVPHMLSYSLSLELILARTYMYHPLILPPFATCATTPLLHRKRRY